jgi:release factor glutamine methyltransferase
MPPVTLQTLLNAVKQQLISVYPSQEAEAMAYTLCRHFFCKSTAQLLLDIQKNIDGQTADKVQYAVVKLLNHTPIQHITGYTDFYGCHIEVSEQVLIPRPESEELVDWILQSVDTGQAVRILDIGAGSGCIAIALARHLPLADVTAWDISRQALQIARRNASINNAGVCFQQIDILAPPSIPAQWDIIVSNPPYVCRSERSLLPANVLCEPPCALFVPDDAPLLFYTHIADFATQHLVRNGVLYFEINERFGTEVGKLLRSKIFTNVELRKDINAKDRMVRGRKSPNYQREI